MKYIPFRRNICNILNSILSAVEKTHPEYSSTQIDTDGRSHCLVSIIGDYTGLVKTRTRVCLLTEMKEIKITE